MKLARFACNGQVHEAVYRDDQLWVGSVAYDPNDVMWLPPVAHSSKAIGVALGYKDHAVELDLELELELEVELELELKLELELELELEVDRGQARADPRRGVVPRGVRVAPEPGQDQRRRADFGRGLPRPGLRDVGCGQRFARELSLLWSGAGLRPLLRPGRAELAWLRRDLLPVGELAPGV